tara:strand:- start:2096 stop:3157 length:1062 start_codon:yes stop_codon:yes gene_type:complete
MHKALTNVGVVFGGNSGEHNVSIKSAETIIKALKTGVNANHFRVTCFYIDKEGTWWPPEIAREALKKGLELEGNELPSKNTAKGFRGFPKGAESIDIWYPVLHGPNGEDGTVQGLFTLMDKPYVGSDVLGSALGMDKLAMKAAFTAAGLPQVPYTSAEANEITDPNSLPSLIEKLETQINYPCFVKPANLGSSVGISKAYNYKQLKSGLQLACTFDSRIVIEKNVRARELECAVLGKTQMRTSMVGEIKHNSDWYDYRTKYSSNSNQTLIPAPLSKEVAEEIQRLSLAACEAITAHSVARVDFFYSESKNEILINEINTMPGFTAQSIYPLLWAASGLNIEDLVAQIVETARE